MGDILSFFPGLDQLQALAIMMSAINIAASSMASFSANIISNIGQPFINGLLTIYVITYGLLVMFGSQAVKIDAWDFAKRIFIIILVTQFAIKFAAYNGEIAEKLFALPENLVIWLLPKNFITSLFYGGAGTVDAALVVDSAVGLVSFAMSALLSIMNTGLEASSAAGTGFSGQTVTDLAVGTLGLTLTFVVMSTLVVVKFALAILLSLGPVFIFTLLFEKTKHFFEGWLAQIFGFVLALFLMTFAIYLIYPILLVVIGTYYLLMETVGLTNVDKASLTGIIAIFTAVFRQMPLIAASITRSYAVGGGDNVPTLGNRR